jgi:hypothetical protein
MMSARLKRRAMLETLASIGIVAAAAWRLGQRIWWYMIGRDMLLGIEAFARLAAA